MLDLGMSRSRRPVKTRFGLIWASGRGHTGTDELPSGIVVIAATALVGAITYAVIKLLLAIAHIFEILDVAVPDRSLLGTIVGSAALAIGACFFVLRSKARGVYALIEISVAFATAWMSVLKLRSQGEMNVWLGFAGAVYLAVRGLENTTVARKEGAWPWRSSFWIAAYGRLVGTQRLPKT